MKYTKLINIYVNKYMKICNKEGIKKKKKKFS